MSTTTYTVAGMTCDHCVQAVRREVGAIHGVSSVDVDLASGRVSVEAEQPIPLQAVKQAIDEAGFDLQT